MPLPSHQMTGRWYLARLTVHSNSEIPITPHLNNKSCLDMASLQGAQRTYSKLPFSARASVQQNFGVPNESVPLVLH